MTRLFWLEKRYPTRYIREARALAEAHGHTLAPGRFKRVGLSYQAVCTRCSLAAWVYPAFPWETAIRGYAVSEPCDKWRPFVNKA